MKKKLLMSIGTILALTTPIVAVVSCSNDSEEKVSKETQEHNGDATLEQHSNGPVYVPSHFENNMDWPDSDMSTYQSSGYTFMRPDARFMSGGIPVPQNFVYPINIADDFETSDELGRFIVMPNTWNSLLTPQALKEQYDQVVTTDISLVRQFIARVRSSNNRLILTSAADAFPETVKMPVYTLKTFQWYLVEVDGTEDDIQEGEARDVSQPLHAVAPNLPQTIAELKDAIPSYYDSLDDNATGQQLFEQISNIQKAAASQFHGTYGALYPLYKRAFADNSFDNDGTIVNMYLEEEGADSIQSGSEDHTGGSNTIGALYNREHIVPKSAFGVSRPDEARGVATDGHFVWPADAKINTSRGLLPYDYVNAGSHMGSATVGSTAVEVDDSMKGDVARAHMYFATTWLGHLDSPSEYPALDKTVVGGLTDHFRDVYTEWDFLDPVDAFDIQRNNIVSAEEGIRNPFIDFPGLASLIYDNL